MRSCVTLHHGLSSLHGPINSKSSNIRTSRNGSFQPAGQSDKPRIRLESNVSLDIASTSASPSRTVIKNGPSPTTTSSRVKFTEASGKKRSCYDRYSAHFKLKPLPMKSMKRWTVDDHFTVISSIALPHVRWSSMYQKRRFGDPKRESKKIAKRKQEGSAEPSTANRQDQESDREEDEPEWLTRWVSDSAGNAQREHSGDQSIPTAQVLRSGKGAGPGYHKKDRNVKKRGARGGKAQGKVQALSSGVSEERKREKEAKIDLELPSEQGEGATGFESQAEIVNKNQGEEDGKIKEEKEHQEEERIGESGNGEGEVESHLLETSRDRMAKFFFDQQERRRLKEALEREVREEEVLIEKLGEMKVIPGLKEASMKSDPQAGSHFGEGPRKPGLVPQSKRPGLSFVESIDWDRESFVYQSATAWDPAKDYAMMADGPEKESYVSRYLRSRQNGNVKYITALIDGDNLLFRPDRMRMGLEGGKEVAEELRRRIAKKHFLDPEKVDFRLRIFCNMRALAKVLSFTLNVQRNEFWEFQDGMTAMNHQTYFINAGKGHQAADLRVKAALAEAILDPSCYKVYLGGLDDYGYKDELRTIRDMGSLYEKVQLIQVPGYAVDSKMYDEYVHKAIDLDYLFLGKKEEMNARAAAEEYNRMKEYTDEGRKRNSPCVFHHLTEVGCKLEEACTFSHDPISEAEKEELRKSLKKKKCPSIVRGDKCMFGDDCFFSH